jgi:hypothetical protein
LFFNDLLIKNLIYLKSKTFKLFKETNDIFYYIYAVHLYERIGNLLENYHSKKLEKIIDKSKDLKSLYSYIKSNSIRKTNNTFKDIDNTIISSDEEICNAFSKQFVSTFSDLTLPDYEKVSRVCDTTLETFTISQTDILRELSAINCNKSSGPSDIPNMLLKKCRYI